MEENKNNFSVLDMAQNYADDNDIDVEELFKKNPVSGNIKDEVDDFLDDDFTMTPVTREETKPDKKIPWTPDPELTDGMDELTSGPLTYEKEELKAPSTELKNIVDDEALEGARDHMDDMTRKNFNIEKIKKELGIVKCQIPAGPWHAKIFAAAGDTNHKRAMDGLREIFNDIIQMEPALILEWDDPSKNPANKSSVVPLHNQGPQIQDIPDVVDSDDRSTTDPSTIPSISSGEAADTKIIIDKTNLPEIAWTKEDMDKIRKSRQVELNIIEDVTLKYTNIEDIDDNAVDVVLSQYVRKVNDIPGALPASKYRATFTGLTYTEILDLSHSQELNNLDGERKKWSIAFEHTKNPSIGPFKSREERDERGNVIRTVTEFDDFLEKTSFMDLEFILWKILCATAQEREIISIDCHGQFNGSRCGRSYDWIYSPRELLVTDSINVAVLEEMKKTSEASSIEEIKANYKQSMLLTNNTIELPTSKIGVVFGHISAYDYLNSIYSEILALQEQKNQMVSQALSYTTLTVLKSFLIPKDDGGHVRIKGPKNLIRVISTLDEIDWQTITELIRIMVEPYQFQFSLRDIVCPQCKTKSNIDIEDITRLLFIVVSSLASVQVVLKRT